MDAGVGLVEELSFDVAKVLSEMGSTQSGGGKGRGVGERVGWTPPSPPLGELSLRLRNVLG